ncbi:MAG: DNA-processing protein DprA [Pseudomonadota bacterium]
MNDVQTTMAWAAVVRAPGLGQGALLPALTQLGDVRLLLRSSPATLRALELGEQTIAYLCSGMALEEAASDLRWLEHSGATLLPCTCDQFPPQLRALRDAPVALYVLGSVTALSQPQVAMVGSRTPTAAGRKLAGQLAAQIAAAGFIVTSGLARGIDTASHEGALSAGGHTIAVLGTGLDICYPRENQALARQIQSHGALVSEFAPGMPPIKHNFPRRNRIISGLARGTVVVEAAADSGSLITARKALEQGRELFAVPGSPLNPQASGCLELMFQGAHLARDAADVLRQIEIPIEHNIHVNHAFMATLKAGASVPRLDKDYEMLLDALGFEPASINDLVDRTGLNPGAVASMMLILELDGRVETRPGALFNRVT